MRAGAVGLSSGLYYAPGSYSRTSEVIAMARAAAEFGGVYESHIRDEADYSVGLVAAVDEVIEIAEQGGIIGVVTHMKALGKTSWGLSTTIVQHLEDARARGVEVLADQYPYEASGTGIVGALMPRWAQAGGREAMLRRIKGELRPKVRDEVASNIARRGGADTLLVSRYEPDPSIEGKRIGELAKAAGKAPEDYVLDLLERGDASLVSFNMQEDDIAHIMRQPWTWPHRRRPRADGRGQAAPACLRRLRAQAEGLRARAGVIDLPFAIRSMTSLTASTYGIRDRGVLRPGAYADLLVFDLAKVATSPPTRTRTRWRPGWRRSSVNGQVLRNEGVWSEALPGVVG